jgi:Tfp pilus assembly protein PilF
MFRAYTWQGTAHMALARPLLGWGPGSFPSAYGQFAITGTTRHAHHVWLQIAAENGIVASLLLLGTCLVATARGWRALRGNHWPLAAGALAALWAFIAHGFTDYGWGTTSIALLLCLTLGLLQTVDTGLTTSTRMHSVPPQFGLRWPWLALTLLVALSAWWMQRVVSAADYANRANAMWRSGSPTMTLQFARDAVNSNPLSARWRTQLASLLERTYADADAEFRQAALLQPTNGQAWRRWAEYRVEHAMSIPTGPSAEELFNRAVQLDPNSTPILLSRGRWLLQKNDPRGWNDLQYIVQLRDAPYGRYPALADLVNLDFARASILLARRALQGGNTTAARWLIDRSLNEVRAAREKEEYWRMINAASPGGGDINDTQDLDEIEAQLNALKEQLK